MKNKKYYEASVTTLLTDLKNFARKRHIDSYLLPTHPNKLSQELNKIQSNLKQEFGLSYTIKNVGHYRKITIHKTEKTIDNIEKKLFLQP